MTMAMLLCKEVPWFKNLQRGYCVNNRGIPGYCFRSVATGGIRGSGLQIVLCPGKFVFNI